ncbi:hypothetical protein PASE110613_11635 [Paenibacillus sediminis]|uniref:Uncharacterized protein n=1 Tax=Paenibacillus sediminis TaxID=664909 RepID=A0ABS4H375_9BACL|nr:hypothetical protein [Paenibacillus sediminis]
MKIRIYLTKLYKLEIAYRPSIPFSYFIMCVVVIYEKELIDIGGTCSR